jgi:hypothetical protein
MSYEIHPLVLAVIPKGEPVYSERVTRIEIQDEAAGPFLEIRQPGHAEASGVVAINDLEEWEAIDQAVRGALDVIKQLHTLEHGK